jgi:hypothetical protein
VQISAGRMQGLLNTKDIDATHAELAAKGVEVSGIQLLRILRSGRQWIHRASRGRARLGRSIASVRALLAGDQVR